jgi:hypothetical protein
MREMGAGEFKTQLRPRRCLIISRATPSVGSSPLQRWCTARP